MQARPNVQVIVPQHPRQIPRDKPKEFSVDDALQFTPLTASVLPAHDRIPIPQITRTRQDAHFSSHGERTQLQQALAQFPVERVKNKLDGLLNRAVLAEIKFKHPPNPGRFVQTNDASSKTSYRDSLSPLAKFVLDTVSMDYRYPSPSTPRARTQVGYKTATLKAPPTPGSSLSPEPWQIAQYKGTNNAAEVIKVKPLIQVPPVPADFHHGDYANIPGSPKRRKLSHEDEAEKERTLRLRTQQEASNASLLQFQDSLLEIFEAQDRLEPGNDGDAQNHDNSFFNDPADEDNGEPVLSLKTLDKLQLNLKKLVSLQRLPDISSEHLRRLQRLCENSIDPAQTINLKLVSEATSDDQAQWSINISRAENGAAAAIVFLYTVIGGPPDESVASSELLRCIPNVLVNIFENCLMPIVEARPDGQDSELFSCASSSKSIVRDLLDSGKKLLDLMTTLCTEVKGTENYVNAVEFLASKLIFVQNANTDKSSALGIQIYEKVRKIAMTTLAKLYARFPMERSTILDEILSSLDKLPSNSRSARQFRLGDGKSIQLISALFMQLVQTTSLDAPSSDGKQLSSILHRKNLTEDDSEDEAEDDIVPTCNDTGSGNLSPFDQLQQKADQLFSSAAKSAQEIIAYLVGKASKTTKSGDSPYRNILDLFIEDLVTVLPSHDWPSSELLLRILAARMTDLARNDKAASTKNMALESLGTMGSAISILKASLPGLTMAVSREGRESKSDISDHLCKLSEAQLLGSVRNEDLIAINGPIAIVSFRLCEEAKQNLHRRGARSYFLAQYAQIITRTRSTATSDDDSTGQIGVALVNKVLEMFSDSNPDKHESFLFPSCTEDEVELSYALTVLNLGFCRRFGDIVKTLSSSFSSDQAQVRSRSLKSVVTMLESDTSLLDKDHTIADDVFKCACDDSAMVRDSALSLIAKFIISKPALEEKGIKRLLECAEDSKIGVQKRSIGHLKEIYQKDQRPNLKAAIARTFLKRIGDHEDTISTLAKQTLEDIWLKPTLVVLKESGESATASVAVEQLTEHIVSCIKLRPEELTGLFKTFLMSVLGADSKQNQAIQHLCFRIVDVLFENTISGVEDQTPLFVLTAFAEANSKLIHPTRLAKLQGYLSNIKNEGDLFMFRSVIGIFCGVLPDLSATHNTLLLEIQNNLMQSINKLARRVELDMVMTCLRTIDGVLHNTGRLVKLTASVFKQLESRKVQHAALMKLIRIGGAIGRHIDLEKHVVSFAKEVTSFQGKSVARYMADTLSPLIQNGQPLEIRSLALQSLGSICQASPAQFSRQNIRKIFFEVFKSTKPAAPGEESYELQMVVLNLFDELYGTRAASKENLAKKAEGADAQNIKQMGGDSKTRDEDSAVASITTAVVDCTLKIALSEKGENAFLAARTLASISHQGLIHPRQSTGAFVALGTSSDPKIAKVGINAHRVLHEQHESHCDREYMSAIQEAFDYQVRVYDDATGAVLPGPRSKLGPAFEIINSSSSKYVKKFLSGLVSRAIADRTGTDDCSVPTSQVLFTRFVVQNIAFFEYKRLEDLLHIILQLELAYSKKGGEVAQALETLLQDSWSVEAPIYHESKALEDIMIEVTEPRPNPATELALKRLAPSAVSFSMLIETCSYLKRQYGVTRDVREAISNQKQSKDAAKVPVKVHGISGDRIFSKINANVESLIAERNQLPLCKEFLVLMNVEQEVELTDGLEPGILQPSIETGSAGGFVRAGTPGARKRKGTVSASNTPSKKARRGRKSLQRSTSISSREDLEDDYEG